MKQKKSSFSEANHRKESEKKEIEPEKIKKMTLI